MEERKSGGSMTELQAIGGGRVAGSVGLIDQLTAEEGR